MPPSACSPHRGRFPPSGQSVAPPAQTGPAKGFRQKASARTIAADRDWRARRGGLAHDLLRHLRWRKRRIRKLGEKLPDHLGRIDDRPGLSGRANQLGDPSIEIPTGGCPARRCHDSPLRQIGARQFHAPEDGRPRDRAQPPAWNGINVVNLACCAGSLENSLTEDAVLVALINESVTAPSRHRQLAARLLVEVLRSGRGIEGLPGQLEIIERNEVIAVADEIRALIERYELGS